MVSHSKNPQFTRRTLQTSEVLCLPRFLHLNLQKKTHCTCICEAVMVLLVTRIVILRGVYNIHSLPYNEWNKTFRTTHAPQTTGFLKLTQQTLNIITFVMMEPQDVKKSY